MRALVGRIWNAAATTDARPMLKGVYLDVETSTLTATDSYMAARVPCEVEDGDESGCIPVAALKEADGQSLRVSGGTATLTYLDGGTRTWKLIEGQFPANVAEIFKA